ncbi:hypothetical protein CONPUDRAFT_113973 [Coniophora puteana RWD-64-598 SS2]|uniref:F-box domain-containing protein n=1 Tax=Coniophora puteana (strain RWD-64-598) TaxID=741705 RepID=A0A5M3N4B6_CONPW|nr:uncharacterized protein CONPUDRAFT_113973 [Coniophora puteana RWD-64-598 SS2]EIW85884.1 hypothetical protein CONPUDRAFT_113973 [Coniophora puteana RWD-64-598 SS2]
MEDWTQTSSLEMALQKIKIPILSLQVQRRPPLCRPRYTLAPIESLPNELLSEIFAFGAGGASTVSFDDSDDFHDLISLPITVSHVCRHWRQVALSTATLWSTIVLTFPSSSVQLTRTLTWLHRSRNRALHLFLDFRDPDWNWSENTHPFSWKSMENVMRLLVPHAHRWSRVELLTDTWSPIFTFLWYASRITSAPILEDIKVSRCNAFFASKGETFRPLDMRTPIAWFNSGTALTNLRRVSLAGVHVDWAHAGLAGLEELELKFHAADVMPTLREFADIVAASPNLRRLAVVGWGPRLGPSDAAQGTTDPDFVRAQHSVRLPNLEELMLGYVDAAYAVDFLSLLCMPTLRHLKLEDLSPLLAAVGPREDVTPLLEYALWLYSSRCPREAHSISCCTTKCLPLSTLESLELRSVRVASGSAGPIRRLLQACSSLLRLRLTNLDDATLCALLPSLIDEAPQDVGLGVSTSASTGGGLVPSTLCPSLESLECAHSEKPVLAKLFQISHAVESRPASPKRVHTSILSA